VGQEVVGRTVRHARQAVPADPEDSATLLLREAQLLVGYRDSPIVTASAPGPAPGPRPGERAPDCGGLLREIAAYPLQLYDLLRGRDHMLVLYADGAVNERFDALAAVARESSGGRVDAFAVLTDGTPAGPKRLPVYRDGRGEFGRLYGVAGTGATAFVVRPDGYLGARLSPPTPEGLAGHLSAVFTP
jgi:hypothetical protein